MPYTQDIVEEVKILTKYNLNTSQEGLKIHSSASEQVVAAAQRLFDKGLTSQSDGGYLTSLGRTAAEHAQDLLLILKSE